MNGQTLEGPSLDEFMFLYQRMNRILTTEGVQKAEYGRPLALVSTTEERHYTDKSKMSAQLKRAMGSLQFDASHESKDILANFGMDGTWPWNFQSNVTRAMFGHQDNGFLPPAIELNLRLHKREY